jgi:hypothetical protein
MVGETGFEPATPWSRRAECRSARRGTGSPGFVSRGQHWSRWSRRITYAGTASTGCDAVWCISGAWRGASTADRPRSCRPAPRVARHCVSPGPGRGPARLEDLELHPHPDRISRGRDARSVVPAYLSGAHAQVAGLQRSPFPPARTGARNARAAAVTEDEERCQPFGEIARTAQNGFVHLDVPTGSPGTLTHRA